MTSEVEVSCVHCIQDYTEIKWKVPVTGLLLSKVHISSVNDNNADMVDWVEQELLRR